MPDAREPDAGPDAAPADPDLMTAAALDTVPLDAARMDAFAFLAGGIAHDLANPLGAILTFASYLATDPRLPQDLRDDARLLRLEAERTHRTVRAVLELARTRPTSLVPVDLGEVVAGVLDLEAYFLAEVDVRRTLPDDLPPVLVDPSRLRHLCLVLTVAAIRALGGRHARGRLQVIAERSQARDEVVLTIEHGQGPAGAPAPGTVVSGLPPAAVEAAAATGVDLQHRAIPDGGRFVLRLPTREAPAGPPRAPEAGGPAAAVLAGLPPLAPSNGSGPDPATTSDPGPTTVLVCDDDPSVRTLLVRQLERSGFRTLQAPSGFDALEVLRMDRVDVVVTDHNMQAMSGIELFERATADWPHLRSRFVLMSGDVHSEDLVRFADGNGITILEKPFPTHSIATTIRAIASA